MSFICNQFWYPPRQIYLNSRFAASIPDKSKKNHCYFSIETINIPVAYDNLLVSIDDAQIPISFYSINETNNRININMGVGENENYTEINQDFTIPVGNYDAISLSVKLMQLVNNLWQQTTNFHQNVSFLITYDGVTNKFTFKVMNSPTVYYLTITCYDYSYVIWGFNENSNTMGGYDAIIVSDNTIDLAGSRFIFVQCPTFGTVNVNSKTGSTNQILAKIPITKEYLEIQQYQTSGYTNKIHNNKAITVIEIKLLDENLNDIDFNGADWSLSMTISILGRPPEDIMVPTVNI